VHDVRGVWAYDWYGQDSGESDSSILNRLIATVSIGRYGGDGAADGNLGLQRLKYTFQDGALSSITQERGFKAVSQHWRRRALSSSPGTEYHAGEAAVKSPHYFGGSLYVGSADPAGNVNVNSWKRRFRRRPARREWRGQLAWAPMASSSECDRCLDHQTAFTYNTNDTLASTTDAEGARRSTPMGMRPIRACRPVSGCLTKMAEPFCAGRVQLRQQRAHAGRESHRPG
jgi:hypothetical protein